MKTLKETKKRKIVLNKVMDGLSYSERLSYAYEEWLLGKANSDKELADKYHVYPQDLSRYLTYKLDLNKTRL